MNGAVANTRCDEIRGPARSGRAGAANDVPFAAVLTLVLWFGCATVGVAGLLLPYRQPPAPVIPPPPIRAQILEVELDPVPLSPQDEPPSIAAPALPPATPAPILIPQAARLIPVAAAAPAIAFPLPVEGPTRIVASAETASSEQRTTNNVEASIRVVTAAEAGPARPRTAAPTPTTSFPAQPLTFGQGAGRQPAPEYPREAIRAGQEGIVRVGLTVGENGGVVEAEVVKPSPWPLLNDAALRGVRQRWRFGPGTVRRYEVPIRFQLQK